MLLALAIRLLRPLVKVYAPQQFVPRDDAVYWRLLSEGWLVVRLSRLMVGEHGLTFQFEIAAPAQVNSRQLYRDRCHGEPPEGNRRAAGQPGSLNRNSSCRIELRTTPSLPTAVRLVNPIASAQPQALAGAVGPVTSSSNASQAKSDPGRGSLEKTQMLLVSLPG